MTLILDSDRLALLAKNTSHGIVTVLARQLAQKGESIEFADDDLRGLAADDPSGLGELLRDITFVGEGTGCYSNFDVEPGWEPIAGKLPNELLFELMGDAALEPAEAARAMAYSHAALGLTVAWYWDGDGTLIFHAPGRFALVNHDCKCSEWDSVDLQEELKKRWNYAEIAGA
jgi:hypothetical protein